MWLSAIKLAVSAGSKIYANKRRTKMAMSDAQLMHAEKMARGEEQYQGKITRSPTIRLEGRGSFDNSQFARGYFWPGQSYRDDPNSDGQGKIVSLNVLAAPVMVHKLWILVVASIYGIKRTQIFRNGGKK